MFVVRGKLAKIRTPNFTGIFDTSLSYVQVKFRYFFPKMMFSRTFPLNSDYLGNLAEYIT
jgi:hypothetical protein